MKSEVYDIITSRIVSMLETGTCPWRRPWNRMSVAPQNYATRRPYNGLNFFLLGVACHEVPFYLTFRQAAELGGHVRKGEEGFPIIYWKLLKTGELDARGEQKQIPLLRYFTVFNVAQVEGIEFPKVQSRTGGEFNPITEASGIIAGMPSSPRIDHGFNRACYCVETDTVQMPSPDSFDSAQAYYATLFHELGHATGHKSRLARKLGTSFASQDYSKEELVAEMTSAFLCAHAGIDNSTLPQQAAYLAGWIKALKADPSLVVGAASQAKKASAFILGEEDEEEPKVA